MLPVTGWPFAPGLSRSCAVFGVVLHQQFYRSADRAFCRIVPKTYQKLAENVLDMLEKTSLCCIRSVLYGLYVLKPAKRADFSMIGRFVNFLM